jgi:NDP-hexose-3-ketoreductase
MAVTALRLGVLGCGGIVRRRALPAISSVPDVEAVALASRDPEKAARISAEFGGEPVTGYDRLLERADVEAVYVALPAGLHHEWAERALLAGKHVLVE